MGYAGKPGALISPFLVFPLSPSSSFCIFLVYILKKPCIKVFYLFIRGTTQVGGEGGGELLVPWPEAMGLIIQLPSLLG